MQNAVFYFPAVSGGRCFGRCGKHHDRRSLHCGHGGFCGGLRSRLCRGFRGRLCSGLYRRLCGGLSSRFCSRLSRGVCGRVNRTRGRFCRGLGCGLSGGNFCRLSRGGLGRLLGGHRRRLHNGRIFRAAGQGRDRNAAEHHAAHQQHRNKFPEHVIFHIHTPSKIRIRSVICFDASAVPEAENFFKAVQQLQHGGALLRRVPVQLFLQ